MSMYFNTSQACRPVAIAVTLKEVQRQYFNFRYKYKTNWFSRHSPLDVPNNSAPLMNRPCANLSPTLPVEGLAVQMGSLRMLETNTLTLDAAALPRQHFPGSVHILDLAKWHGWV
eukprot:3883720-Amphidinium_carterae.1